MRDSNPNAFARQVHFANGFPPKGLVRDVSPSTRSSYPSPKGHYVSLDEVSPRKGRTHRVIPPLAKGRGQFCSVRDRPEDDRYRQRPDPFQLPKAAEKTGFSASQIKHAKPKAIRMCHSTEPPTPPPATATVYNMKNLARRTVYSTPPNRPTDGDLEDDIVTTPSAELKSKNSRIISDVENESIQAELAGLGEVYQRVCRGKIESLHSLLYPSRRETKRGPMQYINTSAPVQLRTPRISQQTKKPTKEKDVGAASAAGSNGGEKIENDHETTAAAVAIPGLEIDAKNENSARPILIPLPYIRSDISVTIAGKQQKSTYTAPYVYSSKAYKPITRQAHAPNNTSPAVINFNPMNIPELSRPGTKGGVPVAVKAATLTKAGVSVPHASMPSSMPLPFLSSPGPVVSSPFKLSTPNHTPALCDTKTENREISEVDAEERLGKLDVESVDSELDYPIRLGAEGLADEINALPGNSDKNEAETETTAELTEKSGDERPGEEIQAKGIRFSLTTVGGIDQGVEIYDYNKRDVESEEQAAKHIKELEEIGQKNINEYTKLLEEHQHILEEVKQLEDEISKPSE